MANKATGKGEPAKQVAIDVLRKAGEPLHAKEIAKRVLASGRCAGLKKTAQRDRADSRCRSPEKRAPRLEQLRSLIAVHGVTFG